MARTEYLACVKCCAPMEIVESVAVLQSLEGYAVFACEWCGQVTLVRTNEPLRTASWAGRVLSESWVSFAAL